MQSAHDHPQSVVLFVEEDTAAVMPSTQVIVLPLVPPPPPLCRCHEMQSVSPAYDDLITLLKAITEQSSLECTACTSDPIASSDHLL